MKKIVSLLVFALLISVVSVLAEDFSEAKVLISSKTPCDQLSDSQLETMGDYYMEQMHPGEAHELMDSMMGGEGSETLRRVHIGMAKRIYCGDDDVYVGYGMMGRGSGMMGGSWNNMMGSSWNGYGMMGSWLPGYGMMEGFGYSGGFLWLLFCAAVVLLALFGVYKLFSERKRK